MPAALLDLPHENTASRITWRDLSAAEKREWRIVNRLISAQDALAVHQGIECLRTFDQPILWQMLAFGAGFEKRHRDNVVVYADESEVVRRVKRRHRELVALLALAAAGRTADVTELTLDDAPALHDLEFLGSFPKLQTLKLSGVPALRSLAGIEYATSLERLVIHDAPQLASIHGVEQLLSLHELYVRQAPALTDLAPLARCGALRGLRLQEGAAIDDLEPIVAIRTLRELALTHLGAISDLRPLTELSVLRSLSLDGCAMTSLDLLGELPRLRTLFIESAPRLRAVHLDGAATDGCGALARQLRQLTVASCPQLETLVVERMPDLRTLRADHNRGIQSLRIAHCPDLARIHLGSWSASIPKGGRLALEYLPALEDVHAPFCDLAHVRLVALGDGSGPPDRWVRALGRHTEVEHFPSMYEWVLDREHLLEKLTVRHCEHLREFGIRDCGALREVEAVEGVPKLNRVTIDRCPRMWGGGR